MQQRVRVQSIGVERWIPRNSFCRTNVHICVFPLLFKCLSILAVHNSKVLSETRALALWYFIITCKGSKVCKIEERLSNLLLLLLVYSLC